MEKGRRNPGPSGERKVLGVRKERNETRGSALERIMGEGLQGRERPEKSLRSWWGLRGTREFMEGSERVGIGRKEEDQLSPDTTPGG